MKRLSFCFAVAALQVSSVFGAAPKAAELKAPEPKAAAKSATVSPTVTVTTTRLDGESMDGTIDLMWVDVQGAQRKVLAGAPNTLQQTRYLYIECHPTPMYDDEPTFAELCGLLPGFAVVKRWEADVLFRNTALTPRGLWHFGGAVMLDRAVSVVRPAVAAFRRYRRRRRS